MARKNLPISSEFPYHITARSVNREKFPIPLETLWPIMEDYLYYLSIAYEFEIHSFVLMPNHFHLIVRAPKGNLSEGMRDFMRETSRQINRVSGRINQSYGARFHKSRIDHFAYYLNVYKYVYANPLRAKLSTRAEEYPYSSLSGLCGRTKLVIPLIEDTLLFDPSMNLHTIEWVNRSSEKKNIEIVRRALKKSVFDLARDLQSGRKSALPENIL